MTTKPEQMERLAHNLTNHPPADRVVIERMESIRADALEFGHWIIEVCPDGRERALALTNLEQTVMWAIAALARNQP